MPPVNHPLIASGAVIVVSLAAAAAIAVYENPELRRYAEQCRRRIALAVRALNDDIERNRQARRGGPRYNRPEDAEGFQRSTAEAGVVDGDEESKRRQREELMYWNQIRLEKLEKERAEKPTSPSTDFDHFLHPDPSATEKGTYVYNSGADASQTSEEGLRRRADASRGFQRGAIYGNPFADEFGIDTEEEEQNAWDDKLMASTLSEGIYEASDIPPGARTPVPASSTSTATFATPDASVIDAAEANDYGRDSVVSQPTTERETASVYEVAPSEYSTVERSEVPSAYATIQAWADSTASLQASSPAAPPSITPLAPQSPASALSPVQPLSMSGQNPWSAVSSIAELDPAPFYSPIPTASRAVTERDESMESDDGMPTPTDSMSVVEDLSRDDVSEAASRNLGVLSDDDFGVSTPGTWTEVGSVVSENEHEHVGAHQRSNGDLLN